MMKKKTLATLLTLTMLTTAAVPVFAAEGGNSTLVTYTPTPNTYQVVIPATTTIDAGSGEGTGEIKATGVLLEDSKSLKVSIGTSTNNFMLKKSEDDTNGVAYKITKQGDNAELAADSLILTVASGTGSGSVTLAYKADKPAVVGIYTDTLTFTAKVE